MEYVVGLEGETEGYHAKSGGFWRVVEGCMEKCGSLWRVRQLSQACPFSTFHGLKLCAPLINFSVS